LAPASVAKTQEEVLQMRWLLVVLLVVMLAPAIAAQDGTLVTADTDVGMYVAPIVINSQLDGNYALFMGGRWQVLFNHVFSIGAGGVGVANEVRPDAVKDVPEVEKIRMAHGGMILEFVALPRSAAHLSVACLVGFGKISFKGDRSVEALREDDVYFVIEPEGNLELNVSEHIRFDLGFGYRLTNGIDLPDFYPEDDRITDDQMSDWNVVVMFKFGKF
jgi:hypothetical protein